ncbi:MAG TPA: hypothetical protein VFQ21_00465 [Gemmatimonadota bacterium]|nr:hypothetical protein [Gemmatimonadota bacterium]
MRTLDIRFGLVALTVALVASAFACQGDEADEEAAPADTVAATTPAGEVPVSSGIEPSPSSTTNVTVTNPMPHAMVVTVQYSGGGETELGTVPAGGEQAFTVAASGGETITLVATDDANSHSPSTTIALPVGQTEAAWTIE